MDFARDADQQLPSKRREPVHAWLRVLSILTNGRDAGTTPGVSTQAKRRRGRVDDSGVEEVFLGYNRDRGNTLSERKRARAMLGRVTFR